MREVVVTGDRHWSIQQRIDDVLDALWEEIGPFRLNEGCADGADKRSGYHQWYEWDLSGPEPIRVDVQGWAYRRRVPYRHFPADWQRYGKPAGPIRNRQMDAKAEPYVVIAFHDDLASSRGTFDMVYKVALPAGREVRLYTATTEMRWAGKEE